MGREGEMEKELKLPVTSGKFDPTGLRATNVKGAPEYEMNDEGVEI